MRVFLDVTEGPRKGTTFTFDRHDSFILGRSRFVHCAMPEDPALSRDHFMIDLNPPGCELRDLGSTNGTFVNNQKVVRRVALSPGDVIAAGQSMFRVRMESTEALSSGDMDDLDRELTVTSTGSMSIRCAGCGSIAPPSLMVVGPMTRESGESIEWWCGICRSDVASLPQPVPYYTTVRELGRGAMGVVYQARHNMTGRMVALKLIKPETATTRAAIDRFQREISVISQLKHPNIVELYEQGMTRGQFWFAMEYVAGMNLEALAKSAPGTYPIKQACRLVCQILKGLEQAHSLGFVHRDIKPENVLIAQNADGLSAKISDFGLAKSFRGVGLSGLTFSGEMRGTVPFMPPEQMLDFKTVTPLADLYSTAATLYYLITCEYLYDELDGGGDFIRILLEESPVPIESRRRDIPPGLADVIKNCLSRDTKARYQTAASMRKAIKPYC
jgi:serine/threonine-protein kinase